MLVLGDVINTADPLTLIPGLREPKPYFTTDPGENRRSIRKLALLKPKLVLAGHGPPLRDTQIRRVRRRASRPDAGAASDRS